jgi:hypothetical protein
MTLSESTGHAFTQRMLEYARGVDVLTSRLMRSSRVSTSRRSKRRRVKKRPVL